MNPTCATEKLLCSIRAVNSCRSQLLENITPATDVNLLTHSMAPVVMVNEICLDQPKLTSRSTLSLATVTNQRKTVTPSPSQTQVTQLIDQNDSALDAVPAVPLSPSASFIPTSRSSPPSPDMCRICWESGVREASCDSRPSDMQLAGEEMTTEGQPSQAEGREEAEEGETLVHLCECSGSMSLVHRSCLEQWLAASGLNSCEICHHMFKVERTLRGFKEYVAEIRTDFLCILAEIPREALIMTVTVVGMFYGFFYLICYAHLLLRWWLSARAATAEMRARSNRSWFSAAFRFIYIIFTMPSEEIRPGMTLEYVIDCIDRFLAKLAGSAAPVFDLREPLLVAVHCGFVIFVFFVAIITLAVSTLSVDYRNWRRRSSTVRVLR